MTTSDFSASTTTQSQAFYDADAAHSEGASPSISVIVPAYNRSALLADTLKSLMALDYPAEHLEIIVVDDASTDDTAAVVARAAARSPFPLHYRRNDTRRGPGGARNVGIGLAMGEFIGFTDSDCQVAPLWAKSAARAFSSGADIGIVSGPIHPVTNPLRWPGILHHQIAECLKEDPAYPTANIFFRKAALVENGGFDERFGFYFWGSLVSGEDTDMAWRVKRAGYRSVFAAGVEVNHEASPVSLGKWLAEPWRTKIFPYLVSQYPELRREMLFGGCFVFRDTPLLYLAVAGITAGAVTGFKPAFAAVLPLLYNMRSVAYYDLREVKHWWKIPLKYGLHLVKLLLNVAALWYGSARARTLVI